MSRVLPVQPRRTSPHRRARLSPAVGEPSCEVILRLERRWQRLRLPPQKRGQLRGQYPYCLAVITTPFARSPKSMANSSSEVAVKPHLARWRHCVSWSLGCLTSTWDIGHGTSQHLTLFPARSI